jgi:hypothetical protein
MEDSLMSAGTIVKVTMHQGFVRPTITFYLVATADRAAAEKIVKDLARPDWVVEAQETDDGKLVERYGLAPNQACPLPPPS